MRRSADIISVQFQPVETVQHTFTETHNSRGCTTLG